MIHVGQYIVLQLVCCLIMLRYYHLWRSRFQAQQYCVMELKQSTFCPLATQGCGISTSSALFHIVSLISRTQ